MLDAFTEVLVKKASQQQLEDELTEVISRLPLKEAAKLASIPVKTAYIELDAKDWLEKYEGTSLFDRAMELEEASLKIEADDLENRMKERPERDSVYDKQDMIRLKKRMLDFELHKSGLGKGEESEDEEEEEGEEEVPESSPPVEVDVKEAEARFTRALVHGFKKTAMDEEELRDIKWQAALNSAIGGAILPVVGPGLGAGYTEGPGGDILGFGPGMGAAAGSILGRGAGYGLGGAVGLPEGASKGMGYLGNIGGGALGGYMGAGMKAKSMAREQDRRAALKAKKGAAKTASLLNPWKPMAERAQANDAARAVSAAQPLANQPQVQKEKSSCMKTKAGYSIDTLPKIGSVKLKREASEAKTAALAKVAFGPMPQPQQPSFGQRMGQTGRGIMNTMKSGATGAVGGGIGGGLLGGLAGAGISAATGGNVAQGAMKGLALGGAAGGLAGGAYGALKGWQQPKVASADPGDLAGRSMAHAFYRLNSGG